MCVLACTKFLGAWHKNAYRYIFMGGGVTRLSYEQIITLIKNEPVVTMFL